MDTLVAERCVACDRNAPRLTDEELEALRSQIPEWQIIDVEGVPHLVRTYKVKDFAQALELTNRIGALAEAEKHHPAILTEWGKVTVSWWTHKIRGLHRNDVIMAAKTDDAARSLAPAS